MTKTRRLVSVVIGISMLLITGCGSSGASSSSNPPASGTSSAQVESSTAGTSWPTKTIQIVVPFKPGGDSDYNARAVAQFLEEELGVSVVISNVDGSGGSVGSLQVKNAAPDGYTMLSNHNSFLINRANGMSDYSFEEFEMVGMYAANPGDIIAVSSSAGVGSLDELIAKTKENPGKMTVATNIGATTQVSSFMFAEAGAEVTQVDVGGITDKIAAILGGHVDIIIGPYGNIKPYLETGEMVALAVTSTERSPTFSDIPTCIEQGYNVYFPTRFFFAFPKGTDQAIVDKMAAAVEKIVTTNDEYAAMIAEAYYETPLFLGAEDALAEYEKIDELINQFSLTALG